MSMNIGLGVDLFSVNYNTGGPFLTAFMASQPDGFFFDFTETDRLFQESTGPTPADSGGESVGLALDQRTWGGKTLAEVLAGQTECISNGDFADGTITGWTLGQTSGSASQSYQSGALRFTAAAAGDRTSLQLPGTVSGRTYRIQFDVVASGNPNLRAALHTDGGTASLANDRGADGKGAVGRQTIYAVAPSNNAWMQFQSQAGALSVTWDIDNISIKEVPGEHAIQTSNRPKLDYDLSDQPELVTNGGFDTDTSWTKGTDWSITGGIATKLAGTSSSLGQSAVYLTANKLYAVEYTITNQTAGTITPQLTGGVASVGTPGVGNGRFRTYILANTGNNYFILFASSLFNGSVDNVSIKEVPTETDLSNQTQLLSNGTFDTNLSGWTTFTLGSGTVAWESGAVRCVGTDGSTNAGMVYKAVTTRVGTLYELKASCVSAVSGGGLLLAGTNINGGQNIVKTLAAGESATQYFIATATTTYITLRNSNTGGNVLLDNASLKEVPVIADSVLAFDGVAQNTLTPYTAGAGENFIVALVEVPASIAANQYFFGAYTGVGGLRYHIGFDPSGLVRFGLGTVNASVGSDKRSQTCVVGMSTDGATYRIFVDDLQADEGTVTGSLSFLPCRIGAIAFDSGASAFFGGKIKKIIGGREFLTLGRYQQIRNFLLNG